MRSDSSGYLWIILLLLVGCRPQPDPIKYNYDLCAYCKMTIADPRYGAELVTTKGKVYKFDAIECMVHYQQQDEVPTAALYLVNTYDDPGVLKPAEACRFLISKELPSPMGANLTAFSSTNQLQKVISEENSKVFSWATLRQLKDLRLISTLPTE